MASPISKIELVELSEFPTYLVMTNNNYIFNKLVTLVKPAVIIYEGDYGVKLARAEFKDTRIGIAIYGYGEQNATWFLREALQKGTRVVAKLGFGVNFGEESHPVAAYSGVPLLGRDRATLPVADFGLLSVLDWLLMSSEMTYSIEPVLSCSGPVDLQEERSLAEVRKKYGIRVMDDDTAYIYDYAARWRARAVSVLLPFIWSESLPEIGAWFNYEPSSKEESEAVTSVSQIVLEMFVEYSIKQESIKKKNVKAPH